MLKRIIFSLLFLACTVQESLSDKPILVTINQFVSHPALDAATKGVKTALKKNGIAIGRDEVRVENAQGSIANAVQIAKHQASLNPNVMIAIATPSAQSCIKVLKQNVLLGFVAVTDPVAAGLSGRENVVGVTDNPPINELLDVLQKVMPKARTIGVVFNPGESNSVNVIAKLEKLATERGMNVVKSSVDSTANISLAVHSIAQKVDVIYLPQDNMIVSAIDSVAKICAKAKIPVISNDPGLIKKKLLFAIGTDYFKDGIQLGNMIAKRLNGEEVSPAIAPSSDKELVFNNKVAEKLGIVIPINLRLNEGKL